MGFSIKRAIRGVSKVFANPIIGGSIGAILGVPAPIRTAVTSIYQAGRTGASGYGVASYVPALQPTGLQTDSGEMVQTGALGVAARGISTIVAGAVYKAAAALGIPLQPTIASVGRVGARVWTSITAFAARNPGMNVITLLLGLGLTAEEAAHFLAWGSQRRRRRRARGISGRDLRTTRRTIRKVVRISHDLRLLAHVGGVARRFAPGRSTTLVRQG